MCPSNTNPSNILLHNLWTIIDREKLYWSALKKYKITKCKMQNLEDLLRRDFIIRMLQNTSSLPLYIFNIDQNVIWAIFCALLNSWNLKNDFLENDWVARQGVVGFLNDVSMHNAYLIFVTKEFSCNFFLAGVNFYRFNAKIGIFDRFYAKKLRFFFTDLKRQIGVFWCKFYSPKILPV